MSERRIVVWVQLFCDRPYLMLQWHDPVTGKRKSQSAGTNNPLEAERKRADKEYELNHGLHQEASPISWAHFREVFFREHVSGRRPNTRANYVQAFDTFERICTPKTLRGVNERTASGYVARMREDGQAASTIKVRAEFLRAALRWACRQKLIPAVPEFPQVKVPRKKPQPVPLESFERLYDRAGGDRPMQAFLLSGWLVGLRLTEAWALEWEPTEEAPWLDLAGDRIVLPAALVKGCEDQWVPLDPELRDALQALPRTGKRVFRFLGRGGPIGAMSLGNRVSALAREAGVRLTMRSLRRGFGCYWASRVPAQTLQKLMRHSSITITMTYYANTDAAAMEAVLKGRCNGRRNTEAENAEKHGGN